MEKVLLDLRKSLAQKRIATKSANHLNDVMLVRVFKYWNDLNILRQTPGGRGEWRGFRFVADEPGEADYVIIHCNVGTPKIARCPRENIWLIVGEPPNETYKSMHQAPDWISRVYSNNATLTTSQHILSYPGLPWHINRDFDFLTTCPAPEKTRDLSWVTSNRGETEGHQKRLKVIEDLQALPDLDLFGRGYQPIADKWDGLASYRYSIAYENYQNSHYWTEKVMDCFLTWTMPIYYGCTELENFFPAASFVRIDPDDPDLKIHVAEIIKSNLREKNMKAIAEARRRVLYDYNFFEFITREIEAHGQQGNNLVKRPILLRDHRLTHTEFITKYMKDSAQQLYYKARREIGARRKGL